MTTYPDKDKLWVIAGEDPVQMTIRLLNTLDPFKGMDTSLKIGIKPNLVCAKSADSGATTHPQIAEGVLIYLKKKGFKDILILEGAWVGDSTEAAFAVCGYQSLARTYGVKLVDLQQDEAVSLTHQGKTYDLCRQVLDLGYLINLPLIKGHCQTKITCALKNLKGVIPNPEKRRYHTLGLHEPIADLNCLVKSDLIISDDICADPFFEEGGRPGSNNRLVAGFDPVLMDSFAARSLGCHPDEIPYIGLAEQQGVGNRLESENQVVYLSKTPDAGQETFREKMPDIPLADQACSACFHNLVKGILALDPVETHALELDHIAIGQAYLGQEGQTGQVGIGDCTGGFAVHLEGCPPDAQTIRAFLSARAGR